MNLGFTLIELLIVVAIIGILAAIAVPNFLNAQIRAKVARVISDMRSIAAAEEQYNIDNGQYTFDGSCGGDVGGEFHSYIPLTTPVPYLSSIPEDHFYNYSTFFDNRAKDRPGLRPVYEYTSRVSYSVNGTPRCKGWLDVYQFLGNIGLEYLIMSFGPDADQNDFNWDENAYKNVVNGVGRQIYDPTNGLVSSGNIFVLNSRIVGGGY